MKLGYCYKTKEGMYSITVDEEFLESIIMELGVAVRHLGSTYDANIYKIWNISGIYVELNELKKSEGV